MFWGIPCTPVFAQPGIMTSYKLKKGQNQSFETTKIIVLTERRVTGCSARYCQLCCIQFTTIIWSMNILRDKWPLINDCFLSFFSASFTLYSHTPHPLTPNYTPHLPFNSSHTPASQYTPFEVSFWYCSLWFTKSIKICHIFLVRNLLVTITNKQVSVGLVSVTLHFLIWSNQVMTTLVNWP